jgi:hypothetical protein
MMTVNMLAGRARAGRAVIATALAALLLPLLAVPGAMPARAGSCGLAGVGDASSPFLVATASDLALVGATCGLDKHYEQTADITLPAPTGGATSNHTPVSVFTGTYDGGGYAVIGLVLDMPDDDSVGLFGWVGASGILRNIRVVDAAVTGRNLVGGLVGLLAGGRVENSSSSGSVEAKGVPFDPVTFAGTPGNAGGLVGRSGFPGGTIERSFSTAMVTGSTRAGGLVGDLESDSVILDSYARGSVGTCPGPPRANVAGLIAGTTDTDDEVEVRRSYSTGEVDGDPDEFCVGGFLFSFVSVVTEQNFWDVETSKQPLDPPGLLREYYAENPQDIDPNDPPVIPDDYATGLPTADMTRFSTFDAAWNNGVIRIVDGWQAFDPSSGPAWGICPAANDGYPFLLWQFSTDPCIVGTETGTEVGSGSVSEPSASAPVAAPSFVAPGGVIPSQTAGSGAWVQADGSSVPLAVSSPGVNQLRYAADGIEVTFTGGSGSSVSNGLVADANGEVVCEICLALAAGQVIEVWMFSTPRLVAAHLTEDSPCQRFSVPVVAPLDGGGPVSAGAHTLQLALPTASGMQAVNVGVTVGGPVPASVPAGEGPVAGGRPGVPVGGMFALPLGLIAGGVLASRRRVEG